METSYDNLKLEEKFNIIKKIGQGSFGEVYLTKYLEENILVASKIEDKTNKDSRLLEEYKIYKKLESNGVTNGIPKVYNYCETPKYNILVMELLGDSLDSLFEKNQKKFSINCVVLLAINILKLIKDIHKAGFIHRDIKPNNFMIGTSEHPDKLFILDFGLSKKLFNKKSHIIFRTNRSLVGTARYAGINVHMGIEPSRRDDLESIGYMLVYFLKGILPWQGIKKEKGVDHLEVIGEIKLSTNINKLCKDIPKIFPEYINYCRKLAFEQEPDYDYLIGLFEKYVIDNKLNLKYDWM
jgi:casein kinase 1 alpha